MYNSSGILLFRRTGRAALQGDGPVLPSSWWVRKALVLPPFFPLGAPSSWWFRKALVLRVYPHFSPLGAPNTNIILLESSCLDGQEVPPYEEMALFYPNPQQRRPLILVGPPSIGRHELRQRLLDDTAKFAAPVPRKGSRIKVTFLCVRPLGGVGGGRVKAGPLRKNNFFWNFFVPIDNNTYFTLTIC